MHGLNHLDMSRLIFDLRKKRIDTLLIEGTHFGLPTSDPRPELEIASDIDRLVAESDSLVLACLSPQHTDRLLAFYRAAIAAGRTFCVDLYTAFVMQLVHSETDLPRPAIEHDVRVFLPKSVTKGGRLKRYAKLINAYAEDAIPISEIVAESDRYVCVFRESMLGLDFGGELPERTLCLYGKWTGYFEEKSWKPVQAALDLAGGRLKSFTRPATSWKKTFGGSCGRSIPERSCRSTLSSRSGCRRWRTGVPSSIRQPRRPSNAPAFPGRSKSRQIR